MKYEEIEPYLIDYIQGKADEATEYRIKAYLQQNPDFQEELDELQTTLEYTQELPLVSPPPALKMDFYAMLNEAKATQAASKKESIKYSFWTFLQKNWVRGLALASVAVMVFFTGYWSSTWLSPEFATQASEEMSMQNMPKEEKYATRSEDTTSEEALEEEVTAEEDVYLEEAPLETQAELPRENKPSPNASLKLADSAKQTQKVQLQTSTKQDVSEEEDFPPSVYSEITHIEADSQMVQKSNTPNNENRYSPTLSGQSYADAVKEEAMPSTMKKTKRNERKPDAKQVYINDFVNNPSSEARLTSLAYLEANHIAEKSVQELIFEQLIKEENNEVRMRILEVIEQNQLTRAKKSLKKLLEDNNTSIALKQKAQKILESF